MADNIYRSPESEVLQSEPQATEQKVFLFNAKGRLGRLRYIAYSIVLPILVIALASGTAAGLFHFFPQVPAIKVLGVILYLVGVFYAIRIWVYVTIQRCHDFNVTGWLSLIIIIPFLSVIFWFIPGDPSTNRFGPPAVPNTTLTKIAAAVGLLFVALYLLSLVVQSLV